MPFDGFMELAKRIYIETAAREFRVEGRKQSISRVSTLTGIYRREVSRVLSLPEIDDSYVTERNNRATRVVGGWLQDPDYSTDGQAHALAINGDKPSLAHLVRKYSGDIPVRAILDELVRVGVVEIDDDGRARLVSRAYVPRHGEAEMINILGTDVADLITTIEHNLQHGREDSRQQLKVVYDNLPAEIIPEFRALSSQRGRELLEEFNDWLAQHDRDSNPESTGTGKLRAGVGIYYFEEELDKDPEQ